MFSWRGGGFFKKPLMPLSGESKAGNTRAGPLSSPEPGKYLGCKIAMLLLSLPLVSFGMGASSDRSTEEAARQAGLAGAGSPLLKGSKGAMLPRSVFISSVCRGEASPVAADGPGAVGLALDDGELKPADGWLLGVDAAASDGWLGDGAPAAAGLSATGRWPSGVGRAGAFRVGGNRLPVPFRDDRRRAWPDELVMKLSGDKESSSCDRSVL